MPPARDSKKVGAPFIKLKKMTPQEQAAYKPKIYVLLPHTKPSAPIYQRINKDQRQRLDKRPNDSAYLKLTFTVNDGKNRTARLKLNANTIWQDEQMKPEIGIGANEPFTPAERKAVEFNYEICIANIPIVSEYLESIPQFAGWWDKNPNGYSEEKALYTLLDKESEAKIDNEQTKKRVRAAAKVADLDSIEDAQNLMIRLNGKSFDPPKELYECQNQLWEFVDDADDTMLEALLKEDKDVTEDEKITILISKAITNNIISFDEVPNQVVMKKTGKWMPVKEISSDHPLETRQQYFSDFLSSEQGKLLLVDLEKAVGAKKGK